MRIAIHVDLAFLFGFAAPCLATDPFASLPVLHTKYHQNDVVIFFLIYAY